MSFEDRMARVGRHMDAAFRLRDRDPAPPTLRTSTLYVQQPYIDTQALNRAILAFVFERRARK